MDIDIRCRFKQKSVVSQLSSWENPLFRTGPFLSFWSGRAANKDFFDAPYGPNHRESRCVWLNKTLWLWSHIKYTQGVQNILPWYTEKVSYEVGVYPRFVLLSIKVLCSAHIHALPAREEEKFLYSFAPLFLGRLLPDVASTLLGSCTSSQCLRESFMMTALIS